MKKIKIILGITIVSLILSCGQSHEKKSGSQDAATAPAESEAEFKSESSEGKVNGNTASLKDYISSSAAVENKKDSARKFIRTANLKFKVKNVLKSTYNIEDITIKHGGFVNYTNLTSTIDNVVTTTISADSSLETTYYTVTNTLIVRVPNTKLDTTLKDISKNIDYLDYRIIKADDVVLQLLTNNLTQKRAAKIEQRLTNAIDNRGKKLTETTNAEELLATKQEDADNAKVSNFSLKDQINFSTISLEIYERQTTKRDVLCNFKNTDAYEPSLGSKIIQAIKAGWSILENIVVFLFEIWGLILIAVVLLLAYRAYINKNSK